jgi:hypothetical protein
VQKLFFSYPDQLLFTRTGLLHVKIKRKVLNGNRELVTHGFEEANGGRDFGAFSMKYTAVKNTSNGKTEGETTLKS